MEAAGPLPSQDIHNPHILYRNILFCLSVIVNKSDLFWSWNTSFSEIQDTTIKSTQLPSIIRFFKSLHNCTGRQSHIEIIKPANILVESKQPLRIKVADLGIAMDRNALKTFCGRHLYAVPEIWPHTQYSPPVDIRSLALVDIEVAYNLPSGHEGEDPFMVSAD